MREIKFRQRNRITGVWFYWGFIDGIWINPKQEKDAIRPSDQFDNPEESNQFTGLKDKNNKEIYEGDILLPFPNKWNEPPYTVEFKEGCFILNHPHTLVTTPWKITPQFEIIGNIYENPELLKSNEK